MKKILLFSAFLGCFALGHAQTKNVVVETAGTLSTLIPAEEVSTLTTLTVSGSINKTDLDTLNGMPALTNTRSDAKPTSLPKPSVKLLMPPIPFQKRHLPLTKI